jgi:hypothetical protein
MDTASYGVYHAKWNAAVPGIGIAGIPYIDSTSVFEVRGRFASIGTLQNLKMDRASGGPTQ